VSTNATLRSAVTVIKEDPELSLFYKMFMNKFKNVHTVFDTIFAPTNDAFKKAFARGELKAGYSLETFVDDFTEYACDNHVDVEMLPETGIQTSTGTIVKVNEVRIIPCNVEHWFDLFMDPDETNMDFDGARRFDMCYMVYRALIEEKQRHFSTLEKMSHWVTGNQDKARLTEIYQLGADFGQFHSATGMMLDAMHEMHTDGTANILFLSSQTSNADFTIINNVRVIYDSLNKTSDRTYTDSSLRALVPRDPKNTETVFKSFFSKATGHNIVKGKDLVGFNSLEEARDFGNMIINNRIEFKNMATEFDLCFLAYEMTKPTHESSLELLKEAISGKYTRAIKFMRNHIENFVLSKTIVEKMI
jgi:hypothetical protein